MECNKLPVKTPTEGMLLEFNLILFIYKLFELLKLQHAGR